MSSEKRLPCFSDYLDLDNKFTIKVFINLDTIVFPEALGQEVPLKERLMVPEERYVYSVYVADFLVVVIDMEVCDNDILFAPRGRTFHPLMQFLKNDVFDDFIGCLIV